MAVTGGRNGVDNALRQKRDVGTGNDDDAARRQDDDVISATRGWRR